MKYLKLTNLFLTLVLIILSNSLALHNEKNHRFLETNKPRISLSQMLEILSKTNINGAQDKNSKPENSKDENEKVPMKNSGYLFYGYNIFSGNPHSTEGSIDPGFTNPIFTVSYDSNNLTGDLRFRVPDGAVLEKNVGCDVSSSSSVIKDASSYQKSLEAEVSVESSFFFFKFAASASFKSVFEGTSSSEDMFVESKSDCRVYSGHLNYYYPPHPDNTFIRAIDYIDEMDFDQAKDDYFTFIEYFGTHFINNIDMGARYGYIEKGSVKDFNSASSISGSVSVGVTSAFVNASGSVSGSSNESKSGSRNNKNVKSFSIGVPPPADGNPLTWAEKSLDEPMPIKYGLRPITEIFKNRYFDLSKMKASTVKIDIPKFAKNLDLAMNAYCPEYLRPRGKTLFCNQNEYGLVLEDYAKNIKSNQLLQTGSLVKFINKSIDKCITFKENRQILTYETCSSNNNQVFKLEYNTSNKAYQVLSFTFPNLGWDYGTTSNRLWLWDNSVVDFRLFTFTRDLKDNSYRIRSLFSPLICAQTINKDGKEINFSDCNAPSTLFSIIKA